MVAQVEGLVQGGGGAAGGGGAGVVGLGFWWTGGTVAFPGGHKTKV
jgi:hypothetical protein